MRWLWCGCCRCETRLTYYHSFPISHLMCAILRKLLARRRTRPYSITICWYIGREHSTHASRSPLHSLRTYTVGCKATKANKMSMHQTTVRHARSRANTSQPMHLKFAFSRSPDDDGGIVFRRQQLAFRKIKKDELKLHSTHSRSQ